MKGTTACLCAILVLGGCVAGSRYRIESFLFDGVPAPPVAARPEPAPPPSEGKEPPLGRQPPQPERVQPIAAAGSTHKPFGERGCSKCHDSGASNKLRVEGNDLCLTCHTKILTGKPVTHVPAVAECLLCHAPHKSENRRLLQQPVPDLCLMCHSPDDVQKVHGEIGECLTCHNPHEADQDRLLDFK
jgi:predicted CXXCH cytochrome family protein